MAGGAVFAVTWMVSAPRFLFSDFLKAYYPAAEGIWRDGPSAVWSLIDVVGFVNLPIVAWLFVPLVPLGSAGAAWAFLGVGVGATAATWALLVRMGRPDLHQGPVLLLLFLVNGPLTYSLREGNTSHIVLLLLVVSVMLWRRGSEYGAGMVLGFCAMVKLPLMLYGGYFLLRQRWRTVAGIVTTISATVLLSLLAFGVASNVHWYERCVAPFAKGAVAAYNVQTVDGFLIRLQTGQHLLRDYFPQEPTPAHQAASILIRVGLFGVALAARYHVSRHRPRAPETGTQSSRDLLEFSLVLSLALVSSPLSWSHYYCMLLLPWGLYLGGQLALADDGVTRGLMWGSILLSSLPVPKYLEWAGAVGSRTVISAPVFGGLLLVGALVRGSWTRDVASADAGTPRTSGRRA